MFEGYSPLPFLMWLSLSLDSRTEERDFQSPNNCGAVCGVSAVLVFSRRHVRLPWKVTVLTSASPYVHMAGDSVAADDVIVQIETDKVTIDVRAPCAGVIQSLQVRQAMARQSMLKPSSPEQTRLRCLRTKPCEAVKMQLFCGIFPNPLQLYEPLSYYHGPPGPSREFDFQYSVVDATVPLFMFSTTLDPVMCLFKAWCQTNLDTLRGGTSWQRDKCAGLVILH